MIMRDSEIKTLFAKADEQVHVDEIRKQKTYYAMIEEMEKQRTPMMSKKNILLHQFWYMDKLFFAVYGVLICLGIIFITALQYTGLNQNGMITVKKQSENSIIHLQMVCMDCWEKMVREKQH